MNTPRTNREIWWVGFKPDERLEAVWADFARDLEKENAALRENFMAAESEIILLREEREELRAMLEQKGKHP